MTDFTSGAAWSITVIVVGAIAWLGQTISALSPPLAARLGVAESESDVDPVFWADVRSEAVWDAATLWTLPVSGVLFLVGQAGWTSLALIGGGIFLYFSGRGIAQRIAMGRRGIRLGKPEMVGFFYAALIVWGLAGVASIAMATSVLLGGH